MSGTTLKRPTIEATTASNSKKELTESHVASNSRLSWKEASGRRE